MNRPNYERLASSIDAFNTCVKHKNEFGKDLHESNIDVIMKSAPSGSGIDLGTRFDWDNSNRDLLILNADFHHMDEQGGYDGWTEHTIRVRASLLFGIEIRVTGINKNNIKEYLHNVYYEWLKEETE